MSTRKIKVQLIRKASRRKPVVIERDDDDIPERQPKVRKKPPEKKPEVSGALLDMLSKLATWTPKKNEDILEVANRLSQAAREEIDKDLERKGLESGARMCRSLVGHVLGYHNGITTSYLLVLGCTVSNGTVNLDLLSVEPRNRLSGTLVNVCNTKSMFLASNAGLDRNSGDPYICDRKYKLDPPGGLEFITEAMVNQESSLKKAWNIINSINPKKTSELPTA